MPLDCQLGIVAMWGEWEGFVKWLMECCRVEVWEQNRVLAGFGIGGKIGKRNSFGGLLQKVMSQDVLITVMNSMSLNNDSVNVKMQKCELCELCEKCLNLDAELSKPKQAYNDLLKNHSQLEKHCISVKVSMQLKQDVFQNDESCVNQNVVAIQEYFEINDLKARLQDKDMTISKLKDTIKSLTKNTKEKNVHHHKCDLEPINKELENNQFDSIKQTRVRHKEQCDSLINKLNLKSMENEDLRAKIQDKIPSNKKNDRISQTPSRNKKNKVEAQPREVNKMNRVVKPICDVDVKQSLSNANSDILCATCNKSMYDGVHDKCILDLVQNGNNRTKSAKKHKKQNVLLDSGTTRLQGLWGYGDYQLGNIIISRVYYVEGLGHNLFLVGQFCDVDLEVAFRKNTYFIRNLEGVDLLSGSCGTNLYTISLDDILKSSPIYLLSKVLKTKSWLWHRRLSHLNFGTLNKLAKDGLARGIPKLKFQKDHLCLACALGKSKKTSPQPKAEDTNQEKLYLLHMDLCSPMRVTSINGKSSFEAIVWNVRRDNGTEFVNQTLCEWYENVGISHQTSVARTPQQNSVVERRNRTLVEAARTIRTQIITETIHVMFDELIAMASEQVSSGPGLHYITPTTSSTGLCSNPVSQQPCLLPKRDDWDRLFQPMFNEYFNPPPIVVSPVQEAAAPRAELLANSLVSTSIDHDAPSTKLLKTPTFTDDPLNESPNEDSTSHGSSSNMRQLHTLFEHLGRWTKDHLIANVIGNPSRSVSTRKQLETDVMWCYFDAFLTSVEPKNFKQAMTKPSWNYAMQEEIHEFERLKV
ncbi:retrovirus-related pol polyprotein from transposon TNT 1-94 [Tanacetum coccineum]